MARDHGGDIDQAMKRFGGTGWIDLSTGINRNPWPVGALSDAVWRALPTRAAEQRLIGVAANWFGCAATRVLPMAGASAPIQLLPRLWPPGRAAVLSPTYNEHAASLQAAGWQVATPARPEDLAGADLAVIVNPNNPDGRSFTPAEVARIAATVGWLIVDESFCDPRPDLSVAGQDIGNVVVLRSFGKFWGLAGLRLGFAVADPELLARLRALAGPWAVNGPALEIGASAMADPGWADQAVVYHAEAALRLDALAMRAGWQVAGGTHLFRLYATPDAEAARERLAQARIWSRIFPWHDTWLRLGIPGSHAEWSRIDAALS